MLINGWDDVERALEGIGTLDLQIGDLSSCLGHKLYELLGEYSGGLKELSERRREMEESVESFCALNKSEFEKKRSRQLHYGRIAFRMAERIEVPEGLEGACIATLKKLGLADCIETRERLDRAALKRLPDTELARCGIRRMKQDHFRIEPDLKLISEKTGRKDSVGPLYPIDLQKLSKVLAMKADETDPRPLAQVAGGSC